MKKAEIFTQDDTLLRCTFNNRTHSVFMGHFALFVCYKYTWISMLAILYRNCFLPIRQSKWTFSDWLHSVYKFGNLSDWLHSVYKFGSFSDWLHSVYQFGSFSDRLHSVCKFGSFSDWLHKFLSSGDSQTDWMTLPLNIHTTYIFNLYENNTLFFSIKSYSENIIHSALEIYTCMYSSVKE